MEDGKFKEYKFDDDTLYHGDCFDVMDYLISKDIKFDAIITDPPYGTTACKWDQVLPFNEYLMYSKKNKEVITYRNDYILSELSKGKNYQEIKKFFEDNKKEGMWQKLNKLIKSNGAIVLFGSEPFSSALRMSNIKNYKYDWKWDKINSGIFAMAKYRPLSVFEDILIFGNNKINYYPIMEDAKVENMRPRDRAFKRKNDNSQGMTSGTFKSSENHNEKKRFPKNRLVYNKNSGELNALNRLHPTQKPVSLMEYLIKTYTNEGDIILDFTAGSGTLLEACMNINRKCIIIEKEDKYIEVIKTRIKKINHKIV